MQSVHGQRILQALDIVFRVALAVIFLFAAVPKMLDPVDFAKAITNYRVSLPFIGQSYVFLVAGFMPALEAVAAVALLWNRTKRTACLLILAMLLLFIVLIAQALFRGLNIDCGCFGSGAGTALAQKVDLLKILENVGMMVMATYIFYAARKNSEGGRIS
jgi:uncharacterized membrane protein YphA (DoxX/SURF4 family)